MKLSPAKILDWLIDFVAFDLCWVQNCDKTDDSNMDGEFTKASDALLALTFDLAPELGGAGRDIGGSNRRLCNLWMRLDAKVRCGVARKR